MKIISGGQTGADRAGLDVAIALGLDYGGALPKGRLTEEGPLDLRYNRMEELKSDDYSVRTKENVLGSDATVVFTFEKAGRGSLLTLKLAKQANKPALHIGLEQHSDTESILILKKWLQEIHPAILNIAGSRESKAKGIYLRVYNILKEALQIKEVRKGAGHSYTQS